MAENEKSTTVTSVFKSGENTTSKMQFTKTWIEMINKIEKGKVVNFSKR